MSNINEFEDNTKALFPEPNAYIQHVDRPTKCDVKPISKISFCEPYECMDNKYIDNGFKKKNCECVPKKNQPPQKPFPFDFKSLMPMLTKFKSGGLADIFSMISGGGKNSGLGSILSGLGSGGGIGNILSMFNKSPKTEKHEVKKSDISIKNYTRVE